MAICDTCGNDYDKTFTITRGERTGTYDSFECAIHAMGLFPLRHPHHRARDRERGRDVLLRQLRTPGRRYRSR